MRLEVSPPPRNSSNKVISSSHFPWLHPYFSPLKFPQSLDSHEFARLVGGHMGWPPGKSDLPEFQALKRLP